MPKPNLRRVGFESLETRRLLTNDFGDAPQPYPTLSADNGAVHVANGPSLGLERDTETDGIPNSGADGDDNDGSLDDEDGVTIPVIQVGQTDASVIVDVRNAPGGARLDAWIDFNRDGSWGGAFEQIADNLSVAEGLNNVEFAVPSWTISADTFARFRLSTAGDLAATGAASDGEVEDYLVSIDPPRTTLPVFSQQQVISTGVDNPQTVFAADLDGDGDSDVLSVSKSDQKIAWYENVDGQGSFGPQRIIATGVEPAGTIFSADIDGDGDFDVLAALAEDDKIVWYENTDGDGNFGPQRVISSAVDSPRSVFAGDVDGDGDLDVLSASQFDDTIAWYENTDGQGNFGPQLIVSTAVIRPSAIFAGDIDRDGDLDVLSASRLDHKIAWYENTDGQGNFGPQSVISTATSLNSSISLYAVDVDSDNDLDVLAASADDDQITWFENTDGQGSFGSLQIISTDVDSPRSVVAADVDGDSDFDVVSVSYSDSKIAWYENTNGLGVFGPQQIIASSTNSPPAVFAADLDSDNDLDIVSASVPDGEIVWYENSEADFGDAPLQYPTRIVDNGAFHHLRGPSLGPNRDFELDGLASLSADGDDIDNFDDEDGVVFGTIERGQIGATVNVDVMNAPAGAKLDAWIDFDGDGTWSGSVEQIADTLAVTEGINVVQFSIPNSAVANTFARFRISTTGGLQPTGEALDGEVEDHPVTIDTSGVTANEFGDAPFPYPTQESENGARHRPIGPTLGSTRDAELDGFPSTGANGDDVFGANDEDGVVFAVNPSVGQLDATRMHRVARN